MDSFSSALHTRCFHLSTEDLEGCNNVYLSSQFGLLCLIPFAIRKKKKDGYMIVCIFESKLNLLGDYFVTSKITGDKPGGGGWGFEKPGFVITRIRPCQVGFRV